MSDQVNIPLLRKAVEWAEGEAAKPAHLREWEQNWWVLTPELRKERAAMYGDDLSPEEREAYLKAPECGTCYCIAGFIAAEVGCTESNGLVEDVARSALDLQTEEQFDAVQSLFASNNTIADVRRIAEHIAGERL